MWENGTPARFCQGLLPRGKSVKSLNLVFFLNLTRITDNMVLESSTSALVQQVSSTCLKTEMLKQGKEL